MLEPTGLLEILDQSFDKLGEEETLDLLREIMAGRCFVLFGCGHLAGDCQCGDEE